MHDCFWSPYGPKRMLSFILVVNQSYGLVFGEIYTWLAMQ